jgi:hypothetical protein
LQYTAITGSPANDATINPLFKIDRTRALTLGIAMPCLSNPIFCKGTVYMFSQSEHNEKIIVFCTNLQGISGEDTFRW